MKSGKTVEILYFPLFKLKNISGRKEIDIIHMLWDNKINQIGKNIEGEKQETIGKGVVDCKSYMKMIL